ncbi:hypothetical protein ELAK_06270 [Elizabethkingia anophelis]|nr:hypothetical protein ELAK_06270 [Elizabethkingia anophelis]
MKNGLSGSLVNEIEVAEYEWKERQRAIRNLNKVKSCPIECSKKPIRIGGVFNEVRYIR